MLVVLLAGGCGVSATDAAKTALFSAARVAKESDRGFADAFELASARARDTSSTQEERDAKMAGWERAADQVEGRLQQAYSALTDAAVALDGWESTRNAESWHAAFPCALEALEAVARTIGLADETIAERIRAVVNSVRAFAGGSCQ